MEHLYKVNYNDELQHHGIEGQKWGKKNGPPYPLDAQSHSASEKKAGTKGWTDKAKSKVKAINREADKEFNKKAGAAIGGAIATITVGTAVAALSKSKTTTLGKKAIESLVTKADGKFYNFALASLLSNNIKKNIKLL